MKVLSFLKSPLSINQTGDDSAAGSLLGYVWRMSGWHQIFACILAVVLTLISLAPIELQRRIVNEVVETQNLQKLINFGIIYVALVLLHQMLKFSLRLYQGWITESATLYTRKHLLGLYAGGVDDLEDSNGGRAVSIVNSEVEKLGGFVGESLSQACANVSMLLGVMVYMVVIEPFIAMFALGILLPQMILTPLVQRRLNELVEERIGLMRDMGDEIPEMDQESYEHRLSVVSEIFHNRMKYFLLKFLMKSALNLLNALGPISVLFVGGYMVMAGQSQVGVIVAFLSGFDRLSSPIRELISFYRVAAQTDVQHRLIAKWMSKQSS